MDNYVTYLSAAILSRFEHDSTLTYDYYSKYVYMWSQFWVNETIITKCRAASAEVSIMGKRERKNLGLFLQLKDKVR